MAEMNTPKKEDKIYFEHLDVIRFVAAFMIIILHSYDAWSGWYGKLGILSGGTYKELTPMGKFVDQFIKNLGLGVNIFFLISGFLITYILLEEKKKYGTIQVKNFMIRRALRIWPLYFLLIGISPFLVNWLEVSPPNYLANIFFVGNFETIHTKTWAYPFAHFWSICIEEHFYLVWPFLIFFIPNKKLLGSFGILILLSILFRIYTFYTMEHPWYTIYLHTLSRIDILVIGAIGAYFYSKKPFVVKLSRTIRILLLVILIISLSIEPVVLWNSMFLAGFKKFFYLGIIALLLLDYNFNPDFKHVLKRHSFIHYLGKVSYGIYMYGNILLLIIIKKIMWTFQIHNIWVFILLVTFLSLFVPIVSYELFEKQILKFNKRFRVIKTER